MLMVIGDSIWLILRATNHPSCINWLYSFTYLFTYLGLLVFYIATCISLGYKHIDTAGHKTDICAYVFIGNLQEILFV